jgi:hypothetical protein
MRPEKGKIQIILNNCFWVDYAVTNGFDMSDDICKCQESPIPTLHVLHIFVAVASFSPHWPLTRYVVLPPATSFKRQDISSCGFFSAYGGWKHR